MFCKPLSYQFFAPKAPTGLNFECLWATFGTNVDKLKLRFCVGGYSKIKLWRACVSPCFVISMRKLLGPFIFMLRLTICPHFAHLCLHWKPFFDNILQVFRPSFSSTNKMEKFDWPWNLVEGTLDTSKVRGEQGGIWEASRRTHHGGGTLEASGRHLGSITLGFPPLSRRCLLEAHGLLTNTVRIPSD